MSKLGIYVLLFWGLSVTAAAKNYTSQHFAKYAQLKHMLLTQIGNADDRIWIATDYLSDDEISTALVLAKLRHVDVQVLLNEVSAHARLSRLSYLTNQGIRVRAKSKHKALQAPSVILADKKLLYLNSELDFRQGSLDYVVHSVTNSVVNRYIRDFSKAQEDIIPFSNFADDTDSGKTLRSSTGKTPVYRYRKTFSSPPPGIATKLPTDPLYKQKSAQGLNYSE